MLNYVDDTIVVIRGEPKDVQSLKGILDNFAAATGLEINFDRTTTVPIHMNEAKAMQCISILGCPPRGQFLLVHKLPTFSPIMAKTDRYIAGWQVNLLNAMGRTVLINSVLDSQLIYAMCALSLPPGVIVQIAGVAMMRHLELSLVPWETVCWSKDNGGLGVRDLSLMNVCLLFKLLHWLFVAVDSAWASCVRQQTCLASLDGDLCGVHWDILRSLLPLYQAATMVVIGNGK